MAKPTAEVPTSAPLAYRLRPRTLDEFVGQNDIVGPGTTLRTAIEKDELRSAILSGPPGTGKTTLAHVIANVTEAQFVQVNAVTSGVKELKAICAEAEKMLTNLKQRTVLFVDEIHRFNRGQQDALLPSVENGSVILIGATTQNPYFDVNAALISRSQVVLLKPLSIEDLTTILKRALEDERGFDGKLKVDDAVLERIAHIANGDARIALNTLELTAMTAGKKITLANAEKILRQKSLRYDKSGEDHYNVISAFIKSMRGSDPDAALLWMFRILESGEDPRFLFRRMAIFASEDVGNADPRALQFVISAWQAFELVGLPEGEFFLAHACVYVSQAPKSNAITRAMGASKKAIHESPTLEVPNHLRNAPVKGMKQQGYGVDYQYPHNHPGAVVAANYFPIGMQHQNFYEPSDRGFEAEVRDRLRAAKAKIRDSGDVMVATTQEDEGSVGR
ncbi:MAG: replication-associated recombination protein A [Candidatus Peribacteraceae bacterium]|nr:replication-associated recombination protein A [Candidatus Peribacteraceae bacterium]